MAVLLATLGVAVVVYGGSTSSKPNALIPEPAYSNLAAVIETKATSALIGDLLTLLASIIYGLYQVLYKKYVALPSDPKLFSGRLYERITTFDDDSLENAALSEIAIYPPFGLHPNFLTSFIGLLTFTVFWIPIPLLHYFDIEHFLLPADRTTCFAIVAIAASGVLFNAGFMILLGVWGPVITSVGNLLTIVLVLLSDFLLGSTIDIVTVWSLVGSGLIVTAFCVLAYDMFGA